MLDTGTTIAILTRADLVIADPDRVVAAADGLPVPPGTSAGLPVYRALVALVTEYGADTLAEDAEDYGLIPGDTSTVLLHAVPGAPWQDAWPPAVDRARIMCQLDSGGVLDAEHAANTA